MAGPTAMDGLWRVRGSLRRRVPSARRCVRVLSPGTGEVESTGRYTMAPQDRRSGSAMMTSGGRIRRRKVYDPRAVERTSSVRVPEVMPGVSGGETRHAVDIPAGSSCPVITDGVR